MESFGVGQDVLFDVALACMTGGIVHLYGHSPHARRHMRMVYVIIGRPRWIRYLHTLISTAAHRAVAGGLQQTEVVQYWESIDISRVRATQREYHALAFESEEKIAIFRQSAEQSEDGSFSADIDMRTSGGREIEVKMQSYDTRLQTFADHTPDVLKIDIEGLETEFLMAPTHRTKHQP